LTLLHGIIDSPDIPLNVSRSYLQSDSNVKKISGYITRKVADKLADIFRNDRESYEKKFDDIGLFVKYGMISDDKFSEKAKEYCLVKNTEGKHFTFEEYTAKIKETQTDKDEKVVWLYASDVQNQDAYIQSAQKRGYDVLVFDSVIDPHFINGIEYKLEKTSIKRVDADTLDKLIEKEIKLESVLSKDDEEKTKKLFEETLGGAPKLTISVEPMPTDELPIVITIPEFIRRMNDMAATSGQKSMFGDMPTMLNVAVNANHPVTQKILKAGEDEQKQLIRHAYNLALLAQGMLSGSELTAFVQQAAARL
jgi:molecular chaperone HtpG